MIGQMQIIQRKQSQQNSSFLLIMNEAGTLALILGIFIFIGILFTCMRCNENEQVPEELEIETVEPSAPVVIEAAVDQAGIMNDALQFEINDESLGERIDLPPAYEELFVKTEI